MFASAGNCASSFRASKVPNSALDFPRHNGTPNKSRTVVSTKDLDYTI